MTTEVTEQPRLLNVRETARRLSVHENTIRNWANAGVIRAEMYPLDSSD